MKQNIRRSSGPVVLCILDGWGYREKKPYNAITPSNTPKFEKLKTLWPNALINTSGTDVGLPEKQMGNSEVGHLNLGAGRVVKQEIGRINSAISEGLIEDNKALKDFISKLKNSSGTCQLLGLLSPGGVHSHINHIIELAKIVTNSGVPVSIHGFLDGRDCPPSSAKDILENFEKKLEEIPNGKLATLIGRYYAMDRDERWERIKIAYELIVSGIGSSEANSADAIQKSYDLGITDEFVKPVAIAGYKGAENGDGILMANFRADRVREILLALIEKDFSAFNRDRVLNFASSLGITEYSTRHNSLMQTIFPTIKLDNILGKVISLAGYRQLRIAETEKYAHVTFFFNGGEEKAFFGEDRVLVPSPKVSTYDLTPEMSAFEVTDQLLGRIKSNKYDFILVNYANADMVGHTGDLNATEKAIQKVDQCLGRLASLIENVGGVMLITADHGNAETMWDELRKTPHTAHTTNPVPLILVNAPANIRGINNGRLCDIAPTILELLSIEKPKEMTGTSLLLLDEKHLSFSENRAHP